jgi:hypothetical protein
MGSELLFRRVDGRPWLFRNVMDAAAYVHKPDLQNIVWQFAQDLLQPENPAVSCLGELHRFCW